MNLIVIIAATLVAGIGSVWLAALLLRVGVRSGSGGVNSQHLLSLAAGALLATAFMHLLPEAFESRIQPALLFGVLLFGLVFFFLLDKAELWHHGHEHHHGSPAPGPIGAGHQTNHAAHDHAHGRAHDHDHAGHGHSHSHAPRAGGGWAVLTGDSVHCFGDGILIASAFIADIRLGLVAAIAVLAHEVPHHIGDLVVLRQSSANQRAALIKVSLAGTMTMLGGIVGWWLVDQLHGWLPYFLVLASSSFVYVALADLIPQLQKRLPARQTAAQIVWLVVGIALVTLVSRLAHGEHDHGHSEHGHAEHGHSEHGHAHEGEGAPAHKD
ncbi:ZIP family metal transporter [Variovorax sp. DXTD-1]|uniref:ZIP family metal transporter n=1 Tax=Variovorax sp. DXTD-1 TaxID=2495592 RepID=UPI000F893B09|nr:ZIP family metal transporter [Variovorax sp. DXTD-1]RST45827.1 ZIP family metal transporter [Variovorax sp. DXTD-1]